MKRFRFLGGVAIVLILAGTAWAQNAGDDRVTVPLSDPSRPATVKVNLIRGSITVHGYAGKDVIVEAQGGREDRVRKTDRTEAEGLKRISNGPSGLTVEEENNVVSVSTSVMRQPQQISIQVPMHTSLKLKTINGGNIDVDQADGEIEVNNINGGVKLTHISGSVVAHALNGNVVVALDRVDSGKPMSFSSLNGNIDVTLPADTKANISMRSDRGEIYSDFEIQLKPNAGKPEPENLRSKNGQFKFHVDSTMLGTLNGGGPEFQFKTFNGNIYIRKGTK
ncbi:MAG: hypothetical protein PHX83_01360 [Acidobacteriia bacterium]|nr:hypothetical protein [Terriglobia bacterium]